MIWKIIFTHLQRPLDLENCPKLQPVYSMPSVSAILEPTTNQHKRINYLHVLSVCDVVFSQTLTETRNTIFLLQGQLPITFGYLFRSHMPHQPFTLQYQYTHSLYCSLYIPTVLTRRSCLTIMSFFHWWSFPSSVWHWYLCDLNVRGDILRTN